MGMIVGTCDFMAPEQVQARPDKVGVAADVYGLGVLLYELLTGRVPFEGTSPTAIIDRILHETPPAVSRFVAVPRALDGVVARLRAELSREGAVFRSDTDTEIIAHMVAAELRRGAGPKAVRKVLRQIDLVAEQGLSLGTEHVHKVRGDLWELLATHQRNPYRFLFYNPERRTLVLLHAFHKKTDAISESDIVKAESRMAEDRRKRGAR